MKPVVIVYEGAYNTLLVSTFMNNDLSQQPDEEIARIVQSGDIEAFGELVARYEAKMMRYARKFLFQYHDAEDAVQDVFLKAYSNIHSFRVSKKFSSWLYRIAHNTFINIIKKNKREPVRFFDFDTIFPHPLSSENADDEIHREDIEKFVDRSLGNLHYKYREVLIFYYLEEMSYTEIAEILRIPSSTVGVRLRRAKQQLKKYLQEEQIL